MEQDKEAIIKEQNQKWLAGLYIWATADSLKHHIVEDILSSMAPSLTGKKKPHSMGIVESTVDKDLRKN